MKIQFDSETVTTDNVKTCDKTALITLTSNEMAKLSKHYEIIDSYTLLCINLAINFRYKKKRAKKVIAGKTGNYRVFNYYKKYKKLPFVDLFDSKGTTYILIDGLKSELVKIEKSISAGGEVKFNLTLTIKE
jgi:hypothetical protein